MENSSEKEPYISSARENSFLSISAKYKPNKTNNSQEALFHVLVNKNILEKISEDQLKQQIENDLKQVSLQKRFLIQGSSPSYSHVDNIDVDKLSLGNTYIQINIPFCLHLPTGYCLEVNLENLKARVLVEKVWTGRARDSSVIDFVEQQKSTYFMNASFEGPRFGAEHKDKTGGWEPIITGKNIEKARDKNGTFRYTRIFIYLDTKYSKGEIEEKDFYDRILPEIQKNTLKIINRIIDAYRFITKEDFVERLGIIQIHQLFFISHNRGYYFMPLGQGIGDAMMNRPMEEIEKIRDILTLNKDIPIHELLFLSANSSFISENLQIAVVQSSQALDIFLENYLTEKYRVNGLNQTKIETILNKYWKTKDRLKIVSKDVVGHSITENNLLWQKWPGLYKTVRNSVVHKNKEPEKEKVWEFINTNYLIVRWVENLKNEFSIDNFNSTLLNTNKSFLGKICLLLKRWFN